jgi:hypothetical protein
MIKNYNFKLFNTSSNTNPGFNLLNNSSYNSSNFLFINEITIIFKESINEYIIDGFLNNNTYYVLKFENLLRRIQVLINKHKVFNNYKQYSSYLALMNILKKFDTIVEYKTLENMYQNLLNINTSTSNPTNNTYNNKTVSSIEITTIIKTEYFKYIELYGVPENGIFLPSLLAQCIDLNCKNE